MKMSSRTRLLSATALAVAGILSSGTAYAQAASTDASQANTPTDQGVAKKPEKVSPEDILQEIIVTARPQIAGGLMIAQREPETTNSISAEAIAEKMALAGPYQLIQSLPGVASGTSDPYQLSIRYALFLRGLPQTDIGWLIDGALSMDRAYTSDVSETRADSENIAGLTVLPGSTRITDPVLNAAGGEVIETIRNPDDLPGVKADYSYGSFRAQRIFGEVDTGEIANTGIKAFGSVSYTTAGDFALPPDAISHRLHADFKFAKDWGHVGKSTIFIAYNDQTSARSEPLTLSQFNADEKTGNFGAGNYGFTFNPECTATPNCNSYWKESVYTRRNLIIASNNEFDLSDRLQISVNPYFDYIISNSPGEGSLNPASIYDGNQRETVSTAGLFLLPNGSIPVKSNLLFDETALGVNTILKYEIFSSNHLQLSWWHDYWGMTQLNSYTPISATGDAADYAQNPLYSTSGQIIAGTNYRTHWNIDVVSIQDSQSLFDDKVKIEVGAKYLMQDISGINLVPGVQSQFASTYARVLPRATVSYDINQSSQFYADLVTEAHVDPPSSTYPVTYSTSTGAISQVGNTAPVPPPEYSIGEEVGYRYHDSLLTADIALFNKLLSNHQIASQVFLNGAGYSDTINGGGLRMQGITAELATRSFWGFSPYVNGQYLKATTTTNLQVGNDYLPTAGKVGVQAPEYTATLGLNYAHGPFFGNLLFRYTGSQYSTFMNDEQMPAYSTIDMGLGYHIPAGIVGKDPIIRLSVTNLGNKPYLSTFASVQSNAVTTQGIDGTTITGKPGTYWLGSPMAIMGTISTSF